MKAFNILDALVVPVQAADVDTDTLIPKQYLKRVERTGLADYLFDPWRYMDEGRVSDPYVDCATRVPNPAFPLNQEQYQDAEILLAGANFGCGSSREQAPWAIAEWGIRALIAPSFGDIFYNNCLANGLLPIVLPAPQIDRLFAIAAQGTLRLRIDLVRQEVQSFEALYVFEMDEFRKDALLKGRDAIGMTLRHADAINAFESGRFEAEPWLRHAVPRFEASVETPSSSLER